DPAHLAGADAEDARAAREHDGVRLHVLRDLVREEQTLELRGRRSALRHGLALGGVDGGEVAVLQQETADELLELDVARVAARGREAAALEQAHVLPPLRLRRQELERVLGERRRDDRLHEAVPRDEILGARGVDLAREREHRAEGGYGVALPGL